MSDSKARLAARIRQLESELFHAKRVVYDLVDEINDQRDTYDVWPFETPVPEWFAVWR